MTRASAVLTALIVAVALDLLLGDPPNRYHPVAWLGRLLGWGRALLARGSRSRLLVGGAVLTVGVAAVAAAAAWLVASLAGRLGPMGVLLEALALKSTLSLRGLVAAARAVAADLGAGDLAAARAAVGYHLVSRPTRTLDEGQLASAVVESVAENLTDGFVAPVCFYLVLGLPGAAAYRAINTADAMLGYREGPLEHFGKTAARLDDLLNLLPARIAGCAIVASAALTGGAARRALTALRRDRRRTASPNAGWTMAAMAGALDVTLEKPGAYRLGDGPLPRPSDIPRSVRLMVTAALLTLAATAAAIALFGS
ncbi:MAG: cobalamin biosynthesis protein CobD [Candidatus Rokubacteria bacterium]|nr:cobalamin biosynthesis protein CobD [Candidatus Rokubacteria bacterium]